MRNINRVPFCRKSALLDFLSAKVFAPFTSLSVATPSPIRVSLCRKFAFTFAELMISLVVISVIAAVLYPTIAHYTPNSNKPLFKSAYKTLISTLSEITTNSYDGTIPTTPAVGSGKALCIAFCEVVNVVPEDNGSGGMRTACAAASSTTDICHDSTLTTTNGMRWAFSDYQNRNGLEYAGAVSVDAFLIEVDVNSSNNNLTNDAECTISAFNTGVAEFQKGLFCFENTSDSTDGVYKTVPDPTAATPVAPEYNANSLKTQDTFQILVDRTGHIKSMSPAAWADLEDVIAD